MITLDFYGNGKMTVNKILDIKKAIVDPGFTIYYKEIDGRKFCAHIGDSYHGTQLRSLVKGIRINGKSYEGEELNRYCMQYVAKQEQKQLIKTLNRL
jgi:hypothetical protein